MIRERRLERTKASPVDWEASVSLLSLRSRLHQICALGTRGGRVSSHPGPGAVTHHVDASKAFDWFLRCSVEAVVGCFSGAGRHKAMRC